MVNKSTGKIFKKARLEAGLTQAELAEKVGITANTYARLERGEHEPSFTTVKRLSKVLGLDIRDIPV